VRVRDAIIAVEPRPLGTRLTPILLVDAIEPVLPFWESVGFHRIVEVPGTDGLGFAILGNDTTQIMYETWSWLRQDQPAVARRAVQQDKGFVFVEVRDIDAIEQALSGHDRFLQRRVAFYGATEVGFRCPGGHYVTFAQFKHR
jgi:hypothetical protein